MLVEWPKDWQDRMRAWGGESEAAKVARLYTLAQASFYTGLVIGGWSGCRRASLQFHAEHQHALAGIKSRSEVSAYLRLRNARVLLGGVREGVRRGAQLTMVAVLFGSLKWAMAAARQTLQHFPQIPAVGHVDELAAAMGTGLLFAAGTGRGGERMYLLRRGLWLGATLGGLLVVLRSLATAAGGEPQTPSHPLPS